MEKIYLEKKIRESRKPNLEQLNEDYSKLSAREIAIKYSVSVATVRSWIYRERKKIKGNNL